MRTVIGYFGTRHFLANLLLLSIVLAGSYAAFDFRKEELRLQDHIVERLPGGAPDAK